MLEPRLSAARRARTICGSAAVLAALALASACGGQPIETVDPATIPAQVSYATHIVPIMNLYCVACHSSRRRDYTTYDGVRRDYEGIRETVFEESTMPPGAARRLSPREQAILRRWRDQGFPP